MLGRQKISVQEHDDDKHLCEFVSDNIIISLTGNNRWPSDAKSSTDE